MTLLERDPARWRFGDDMRLTYRFPPGAAGEGPEAVTDALKALVASAKACPLPGS